MFTIYLVFSIASSCFQIVIIKYPSALQIFCWIWVEVFSPGIACLLFVKRILNSFFFLVGVFVLN